MERGDLGLLRQVEDDVLAGRALLWLAWDGWIVGAGVTQVHDTERSKVCTLVAWQSDDMARTLPLLATVEDYARDMGCDCVRVCGRQGWARVLDGYRVTRFVLERRL